MVDVGGVESKGGAGEGQQGRTLAWARCNRQAETRDNVGLGGGEGAQLFVAQSGTEFLSLEARQRGEQIVYSRFAVQA